MAEFMQDKREHPYADWLRESPTSIQAIQKLQELEDKYCKSVNNTTPEMTKLLEWILLIESGNYCKYFIVKIAIKYISLKLL